MTASQMLQQGYARLLDVPPDLLNCPGLHIVETPARNQPEWANWVQQVWCLSMDSTIICSVAPEYQAEAKREFANPSSDNLLSKEALQAAYRIIPRQNPQGIEWVQCEVFAYLKSAPPALRAAEKVEEVRPTDEKAKYLLRHFDGGVFGLRANDGSIAAHACIKDKGLLQEIAVGTEPEHRQQGLGKTVVAHAVTEILQRGKVPVYWPDSRQNVASYALAQSLGFEKVAEMMFCCYATADWAGFSVDG